MTDLTPEQMRQRIAELEKALKHSENERVHALKASEKALAKSTRKIERLEKKITAAQNRRDSEIRRRESSEAIAKKLTEENAKLKSQMEGAVRISKEALPTIKLFADELEKQLSDDPDWNQIVIQKFVQILQQVEALARDKSVYFKKKNKGNESLRKRERKNRSSSKTTNDTASDPQTQADQKEVQDTVQGTNKKLAKSAQKQTQNGMTTQNITTQALDAFQGTESQSVEAMNTIYGATMSESAQKYYDAKTQAQPSKGRQVTSRKLPQVNLDDTNAPASTPIKCPVCGGTHIDTVDQQTPMKTVGILIHFFEALEEHCQTQKIAECRECGACWPIYPDNVRLALNPKREITIETLTLICEMMVNGIPLHRIEEMFFGDLKAGSSTLSENLYTLGQYVKPLFEAIEAQAAQEKVCMADESPLDVLQSQGRGHQKNPSKEDKKDSSPTQASGGAQEEPNAPPEKNESVPSHGEQTPADETIKNESPSQTEKQNAVDKEDDPRAQPYVEAVTSMPEAIRPFALYYIMRGRTIEDIRTILDRFNPDVLMTDGYTSYNSITRNNHCHHAACLVHWRRVVMEQSDLESQAKLIHRLGEANAIERYREKIEKGDAQPMLNSILAGISKVSAEEHAVVRQPDESLEAFHARRLAHRQKYSRPIMDAIDEIARALALKAQLIEGSTGVWTEKPDHVTYYGKAIVYYMNRRNELRYFLEDGRAPISSNEVERSIRPITLIRSSSYFFQNLDYTAGFLRVLSLFETAQANGIKRPEKWLRNYLYRLAKHCQREQWLKRTTTTVDENGKPLKPKDPSKQFVSWEYEKHWGTMPLDDLLPWNYQEEDETTESTGAAHS